MARRIRFAMTVALVLSLSPVLALSAQQAGTIEGRVLAEDSGRPLAGAQVFIPGSGLGALTGNDGRYTLRNVPTGETRVRARLIGHRTATRTVSVDQGETITLIFRLAPSALQMESLVVTATGTQRRVELGNAIETVQLEEAEAPAVRTFSDMLTGRASGVTVQTSGGTVGTGARIRIRGSNSISLSNEPIIYLDGVRINNQPNSISFETGGQAPSRLNDIDPEAIESVEVVKGPSAATLYGTEAANGVIRIETRRGTSSGEVSWRGYVQQGFNSQPGDVFPANWRGFDAADNICTIVDMAQGACTQERVQSFNPLEDPRTSPYETGRIQTYGLNVRGGQEGLTYYVSGRFEDEEGVVPVNDLQRGSAQANLSFRPASNLDVSLSNSFISSDLALPLNDNFSIGLIPNALAGFSTIEMNQGYGQFTPPELFTIDSNQTVERYTGSMQTNWRPWDFFEGRATVGLDFVGRNDIQFFPTGRAPAFLDFDEGAKFNNRFQEFNWTVDVGGNFTFDLSDRIASQTSVGFQYFEESQSGTIAEGRQLVAGTNSIAGAAQTTVDEVNFDEVTVGAFVQERVSLNDRLFLTAAVRVDDNSAFGADLGAIALPKVSGSWLLSEEPFFPDSDVLNSFRLRAAWGQSAVQPGPTDALRFFEPIPVAVGGQSVTGVTFGGLGNPELKPERSTEIEAGFDAEFADSRIQLSVTGFNKTTDDALVFRELPPSLGASEGRFENLASVRNTGIDGQLLTRVLETENLDIDLNLTGSVAENELEDLGGVEPIIFRFQRHVVGFPLGGYWDLPIESFEDANGDGILVPSEVTVGSEPEFLGSPFPARELSIEPRVNVLDRVQARALVSTRGGYQLLNFTEAWRLGQNNTRGQNDPDVPLEEQARAVASKFLGTDAGYVEDASFWRLREVSLTLNAPAAWSEWFGGRSMSLTLAGRNLGLITDYSGVDPEVNETGQTNFLTREFMTQPPTRRFTARLNVSF